MCYLDCDVVVLVSHPQVCKMNRSSGYVLYGIMVPVHSTPAYYLIPWSAGAPSNHDPGTRCASFLGSIHFRLSILFRRL